MFVRHIGFLKVHKAGSSTLSNVLFRFGVKNNLTFALPMSANYLKSRETAVTLRSRDHFDIIAVHSRYSPVLYNSVLANDAVKIAIIREPLDRMISAAYYYRDKFQVKYLKNIPRQDFAQNLVRHADIYDKSAFSFTKNSMANDFGFDESLKPESTLEIKQYLYYLNKEFQLVMVMERFEESLVLMKMMFNWTLQDILFLKSNSNPHKKLAFTAEDENIFRSTCFLDVAIYDYFTEVFNQKIEAAGETFKTEVAHFKETVDKVSSYCANKTIKEPFLVPSSTWNEQFGVTRNHCVEMRTSVLDYIDFLRKRHVDNHY